MSKRKKAQAPPPIPTLSWKRGKRQDLTPTGTKRMVWESRCGRYRVERLTPAYDAPEYFLAITGQHIISRHRKRSTAEEACENYDILRCNGQ